MSFLTPKEILEVAGKAFPTGVIKAKGIVLQDGSYYKLADQEAKIDLLVEELEELPIGAQVEVEGFLKPYVYPPHGGIYAKLKVKSLKVLDDSGSTQGFLLEIERRLRQKTHRGFAGYVQSLIEKNGAISIAILHGKGAQVHKDFEQAFVSSAGPYRGLVELNFFETSLSDDALAQALEEVKDYPMVFLLRGGGAREELQKVGGFQSATAVLERDIPLYVALGHSLDKGLSLMEKVCEYAFATPSIAGAELGRVVRQVGDLHILSKEKQDLLLKAKLVDELRSSLWQREQQIRELQEKAMQVNPLPILFALLAGGMVGFLIAWLLR